MSSEPVAVERAAEPHPEAATVLDQDISMEDTSVTEMRQSQRNRSLDEEPPEPVGRTVDAIVRENGHGIPVRVYVPEGEGPFPVLVWAHGGRFVLGDIDTEDATARALTNEAECVVVSVEYRLAPEHPFPAALHDYLAVLAWAADATATYEGDVDRVLVGGQSAGANLAAAASLYVRDHEGPSIAHQVLIVPAVNYSRELENGRPEGRRDAAYLSDPIHGYNPYAYPLEARAFGGLPSASIVTVGFDSLRHEGKAYADALYDAGVEIRHHHRPGTIHLFFTRFGDTEWEHSRDVAATIGADIAAFVR